MPPRKKANSSSSSSKKSESSQHIKYGIQHFFLRHSQSQNPKSSLNPKPDSNLPSTNSNPFSVNKNASDSVATTFENTPPNNLVSLPIGTDVDEQRNSNQVSPEISKSLSIKRFKFSPGMLIKQSQDDGGDEVTWKISPINERLQAASKHNPDTIRVLADSSRHNSLLIRQCCHDKTIEASTGTSGKVDKWLSSPMPKVTEGSLVSADEFCLKKVNPNQDVDLSSQGSPFRTPPSLSYHHDKVKDITCDEECNQLDAKQNKKALLELLDQVEDVISVDPISTSLKACSSKFHDNLSDKIIVKAEPASKTGVRDPPMKVNGTSSGGCFLVLEVSEKRISADPSGVQCPCKVLRVLNELSGEERTVCLWEEWFYSVIAPGDTVNVIGEFDDQGKCDVDRDNNLLIVHPFILVSGTRVAASFSCPRRTVLDERLKCSEQSTAALVGTMLHQIFQAGLVKEVPNVTFLEEYARIVLQKNIESLYACGANENEIVKTLIEAIPKLLNWIILFKNSQHSEAPAIFFGSDDGPRKVKISEVIDIEEMAWAPKYGLKGMIDASIRVNIESSGNVNDEKIVPLEFKTGKVPSSQSSMEHCAQVILYTLLMSDRYLKHINCGLLYYLQSEQTQGIMVQRSDLIGLVMRRNELANDILNASKTQQLPPMLRVPSMCRGCRHLQSCTVYHKAHGGSTESSGLGDLFESHVHHLTTVHFSFLRHWDRLIDLEAREMQLVKNQIWHSNGRSNSGLSSVVLDTSSGLQRCKDNRFIYRFVGQNLTTGNANGSIGNSLTPPDSPASDLDCTLKSGDFVILSTESGHRTVASGFITDISHSHVLVSFSKCLRLPESSTSGDAEDIYRRVWRIDKDEAMTLFSVMRFNLVQLFIQKAESSQLRKMIVDLEAPRFDSGCIFSQDPATSYIWSEKGLNDDQRRAILKILTAKDYALILGMPGTGKTSTLVHAVKALLMRGSSILLTSYTNSAVDNLLVKLKAQNIDFLRIGRHEAVRDEIQGHCLSAMKIYSIEQIKKRLDQVKVVAVTCLGITNPLLANKRFDVCIMDEAGQTTLPVSLGPLLFASMFVLVGDHYQLPPLVQSSEARENGMEISLFRRLSEAHPQAISALQSQYRMCRGIMELSNSLIYGDRLRCGSSEIADAKIEASNMKSYSSWLKEVLDPSRPVLFINTDMLPAFEVKDYKTLKNPIEACIIAKITEELVSSEIESKDIGIITPYNSQVNLIRNAVQNSSVEIHTIDKYQGRDKDCILVSFVRSSENPRNCNSSLLGDWHRINVALTRAKKKLIMVGSCTTLSKVPLLKLLIDKVDEQTGILILSKKDINHLGDLKRCSHFDT